MAIFCVFGFVFYGYVQSDFQARQALKMLEDIIEDVTLEEIRDKHDHVTIMHKDGQMFCEKGIFSEISNMHFLHNTFYDFQNETYFIARKKLSDGTEVCVAEKVTEIHSELSHWVKIYITLSVLFSVCTYFIGLFFARLILQPLRTINVHSQRFYHNAKERIPLPKNKTNDDLTILTNTLNDLFDKVANEQDRLNRFSSDVSHEFKNALFEIRSTLDLTQKKGDLDTGCHKIKDRIDGLDELIESLLLLARMDSQKIPTRPIQLESLIKDLSIIQDHSGEPNINLNLAKSRKTCNPELLKIALTNLIGNAIKFTPTDKNITINLKQDRIEIIDEGIGMKQKELDHIWDRFYKANSSREYGSGQGLGLAISREIIQKVHSWNIEVSSKKGAGTKVVIRF